MKPIDELRQWIVEHYGPIHEGYRGGEYIAAVPVLDGWCFGIGSRRANAIFDMCLDLRATGLTPLPGMAFLPWEKKRHQARRPRLLPKFDSGEPS